MKRLHVIVEGETEEAFVNLVIAPHFVPISVTAAKIKHSKGGLSKYIHLQKDIIKSVRETDLVLTTLIDYYGLPIKLSLLHSKDHRRK